MTDETLIEIVKLTPDHARDYKRIREIAFEQDPDSLVSEHENEADLPESHFRRKLEENDVFAAYVDGRIAGTLAFTRKKGPKERHKGYLWGMFIDREYRKMGLAKHLNEAVIEHAKGLVDTLDLKTIVDNKAAIALCSEYGFKRYGTKPKGLKIAGRHVNVALMILDLTAETHS